MQMPKQPNKEQFDRAFMSQMVKDHEKALKLAQDAAKNAKDAEKHLQMAKQTSDKASAGASAAPKKNSGK
jgi:uncharacterized protein (DUF305 family)